MTTISGDKGKDIGPQGNPLEGEATVAHTTDAEAQVPVGNAPNDDESAQQGEYPDVTGPLSSGGEGTKPADYIATDGDVQGNGRTTEDLKDRRVIDEDAPFDYNTLPDTSDVQGNKYPPGEDFFKAEAARAEQAKIEADRAAEDAQSALDRANDAMNKGQSLISEAASSDFAGEVRGDVVERTGADSDSKDDAGQDGVPGAAPGASSKVVEGTKDETTEAVKSNENVKR